MLSSGVICVPLHQQPSTSLLGVQADRALHRVDDMYIPRSGGEGVSTHVALPILLDVQGDKYLTGDP
jgi:hypothetical protein